jgi:hypothetical protein
MVALLKEVRAAWAALTESPLGQDNEWLRVPRKPEQFSDLRAIHKNRLLSAIRLFTIVSQNQ